MSEQVNLDIYYKIKDITSEVKIDENYFIYHTNIENINPNEINGEKIKEFLKEDGIDIKDFNSKEVNIKYNFGEKEDENNSKILEENKLIFENAEKTNEYKLFIKIEGKSNFEEKEKEEKKKEKKAIKELLSKSVQMINELTDINNELRYTKEQQKNYYESLRRQRHSIHENKKKKDIQKLGKVNDGKLSQTDIFPNKNILLNNQAEENKIKPTNKKIVPSKKAKKLFFLYSFPLQKNNMILKEDFSCYQQWLCIYKLIKKNHFLIKPYYELINEKLYLEQNPMILHIRVDSVLINGEIHFKFGCEKHDINYLGYNLEKLIECLKKKSNELKLVIISSNNTKKIYEKFEQYQSAFNFDIIFINHDKNIKSEEGKENEKYEIQFIEEFYSNLSNLERSKKFLEDEKKKNKILTLYKNKEYNCDFGIDIDNCDTPEEIIPLKKYLLDYDSIMDNYCPLIGRKEEFAKFIISNDDKMCIYGPRGVGKKLFSKKVGFTFCERHIVDKAYFLEIYPMEISNKIFKMINILINEIENIHDKENILLIIYFNGVITKKNINEIINEIMKERELKNKNIKFYYLFVFTYESEKKNENEIIEERQILTSNEVSDILELTDFIQFDANDAKDLYNYCINKNDYYNNDNIFGLIDNIFNNDNNKDKKPIKINNVYLVFIVINLKLYQNESDIIDKSKKIIFENDKNTIKEIIEKIMKKKDMKDIIENLFIYLHILENGVEKKFLQFLLNIREKDTKKIDTIKIILNGLIIVENNENGEIFKLDNTFRELIGEILKDKINGKIIQVWKYYIIILKKIAEGYEYNKILDFNALIENYFWYTNEARNAYGDIYINGVNDSHTTLEFVFNDEIDSNNIKLLLNKLKNDKNDKADNMLTLFDYISIALPTLLDFKNNNIYEDLMIIKFEDMLENQYQYYKNKNDTKNTNYISKLIIRLGIFKCRTSKKLDFLKESLNKVDLNEINEIKDVETKIECYLIQLYYHLIFNDKNIETLRDNCLYLINELKDVNEKAYFEIRCEALSAKFLYSIDEIDSLINANKVYEEELKKLKEQIRMYSAKNKFYFFLENPLNNESEIDINNNFFLTQKLLDILPKNINIEFKTFNGKEKTDYKIDDIKKMNFLYLAKKNYLDSYLNKNNIDINISILILGERLERQSSDDEAINNLRKKGIKNIIYLSKENIDKCYQKLNSNEENKCINKKIFDYFLEKLFYEFIHEFISIIIKHIPIEKAFDDAKFKFLKKFKCKLKSFFNKNKIESSKDNMISEKDFYFMQLKQDPKELFCDFEDKEDENLLIKGKAINDIFDEYEDEISKKSNVYYRKNPFAEKQEIKKKTYLKYMKLPGKESLSESNFDDFVTNGIPCIKFTMENIVKNIEKEDKTNIINLYGNMDTNIGKELCKYFYMQKKFINGIYIIKCINQEDLSNLISNIVKTKEYNVDFTNLILIDNMNEANDNFTYSDKVLDKMIKAKSILFIICSLKEINIGKNNMAKIEWKLEEKDQELESLRKQICII